MTVPASTPDIDRVAWGFQPEDSTRRLRTRLGSAVLVDGALRAAGATGNALSSGMRRTGEAVWARTVGKALGLRLTATGIHHLDAAGPAIIMPLHESFVDVVALLHLPIDAVFTVRDELFDLTPIGSYLRASGQIVVPHAASRAALRTLRDAATSALGAGKSVVVFPQGSVLGVEIAFEPGAFVLARTTGVPIIPVVITGSHRVWEFPFSQTLRYDQPVDVHVLEPIPAAMATRASMRETERTMKAIALASSAPARRFVPERDGWWDDYAFEIDEDFADLRAEVDEHRSARD